MFCTECGTRNTSDSKYCKECGTRVDEGYRQIMLSVEDRASVATETDQERLTQLLDMAFWHNEAGHTKSAMRACEAALAIHPNCTTAHSLLGTLYEKKGDDDKAIDHFEKVIELNPASAADAAKLEQLKRGVHARPVAAPPVYKWLPPALAGFALGGYRVKVGSKEFRLAPQEPETAVPPKRNLLPIYASAAATVLVVTGGWIWVVRPAGSTTAHVSGTTQSAMTAPVVSQPPQVASTPMPAPVYLSPNPGTAGMPVQQYNPDPFANSLPAATAATGSFDLARTSRILEHRRSRSAGATLAPLPPLNLQAVPAGGEVAPAPVAIASPVGATGPVAASVADVPQHTVVVSHIDEPQTASQQPPAPSATDAPSYIHITIHSANGSPSAETSDAGGESGDGFQQEALALQEQGDYRKASSVYKKAIQAYRSQIAAGQDADAAQRGLQASQTGLQICAQNQP